MNPHDEAVVLGLLWFAALTLILWMPALLIRFVLLRRPLGHYQTLAVTAAIWFVGLIASPTLWDKTPQALHVAAIFSFSTLKAQGSKAADLNSNNQERT